MSQDGSKFIDTFSTHSSGMFSAQGIAFLFT